MIVKDASIEGIGPAIAIASCSPMYPRPTLEILHDYFKWVPDGKGNLFTSVLLVPSGDDQFQKYWLKHPDEK